MMVLLAPLQAYKIMLKLKFTMLTQMFLALQEVKYKQFLGRPQEVSVPISRIICYQMELPIGMLKFLAIRLHLVLQMEHSLFKFVPFGFLIKNKIKGKKSDIRFWMPGLIIFSVLFSNFQKKRCKFLSQWLLSYFVLFYIPLR